MSGPHLLLPIEQDVIWSSRGALPEPLVPAKAKAGTQWAPSQCITDQQKVAGIFEAVHSLLARQIGIVSVCDVEVIRQEHF